MRNRDLFQIALRYTLAYGRGHLSVFMSSISTLGLVLGTALLLTVLSVMNGFDREMRERILALVPHSTVHTAAMRSDADTLGSSLLALPGVESAEPFVAFQGMAMRGAEVIVVAGLGLAEVPTKLAELLPQLPETVANIPSDQIVLGDSVAAKLKVSAGDTVTLLVASEGGYRGRGVKNISLPVAAVLDTGTELDESLALLSIQTASHVAGLRGDISGYHLRFADPFAIDRYLTDLRRSLPPGSYATTWQMTHGNLYSAIQLSRSLVVLLVMSIIGVAAFNVVSALVLIVIDQRRPIAILRTQGATRGAVARLFVMQGLIVGVLGTGLGCALGIVISQSLPALIAGLESVLQFRFLNTDVYPVSFVPVDLRFSDVVTVSAAAVTMCVLAALYPAYRASRVDPARILHQDR